MGNNSKENNSLSPAELAIKESFHLWLKENKDNIRTEEELERSLEEYYRGGGREKLLKEIEEKKRKEEDVIDDKFLHGELLLTPDGYIPMSLEKINDPGIPEFSYYCFGGVIHQKKGSGWEKIDTSFFNKALRGIGYAMQVPHIWITRPSTFLADMSALRALAFFPDAPKIFETSNMVLRDMDRRKYHNRENIIAQEIKKSTTVAATATGYAPLIYASIAFGVDDILSSKTAGETLYNGINTGLTAFGLGKGVTHQLLGNFATSLTMADTYTYLNGGYIDALDYTKIPFVEIDTQEIQKPATPKTNSKEVKFTPLVPIAPVEPLKPDNIPVIPTIPTPHKDKKVSPELQIILDRIRRNGFNYYRMQPLNENSKKQENGITGAINKPNININGSLVNNIIFNTTQTTDPETIQDLIVESLQELLT